MGSGAPSGIKLIFDWDGRVVLKGRLMEMGRRRGDEEGKGRKVSESF